MTPEERFERIETQLELVVGQQGQFYTDLRNLAEQVGNQGKQISQVVTVVSGMGDILRDVLHAQERTETQMRETDRRLQETDRRLLETDQRLNVLIAVVERYIAHNGQGPAENPPSA